jgi:predicted CXXCH cytochrome family protein
VASLGGKIHPLSGVRDPRNPKREMSCVSCHNPHSADNAKLFTAKRRCQMCHKRY